jgi:hypothetical protein
LRWRRPRRLLAAFLLGALAAAAGRAQASAAAETAADGPWRWSEGVYRWHYSRAGEPAWLGPGVGLQLFRRAAEAWAVCGVRLEFAGETDLSAERADGVNVAGWSTTLPPNFRGITRKRRAASALLEADIAISAANREFRGSPGLLSKVILHEFGHALGLVHSPDCRDVMSFGATCRHIPTESLPQQPAAGDLLQCTTRYGGAQTR